MYDKAVCPYCKTMNLVYLGDWEDDTSPTIEAAECYACGKHFLMGGKDTQEEMLEDVFRKCIDDDAGAATIITALLRGDSVVIDDETLDLSAFLREYACSNKGEKCQ